MEMQGSRHLAVTQQQAWDALNDPRGAEDLHPGLRQGRADRREPVRDRHGGEDRAGVGASFAGKIMLADVLPPNSYTSPSRGRAARPASARARPRCSLAPPAEGAGCELTYTAQAQVGGKIAQVGQRLIDGVARSMAEDFFKRFDEEMQRRHPDAYARAGRRCRRRRAGHRAAQTAFPCWAWIAFAAGILLALVPVDAVKTHEEHDCPCRGRDRCIAGLGADPGRCACGAGRHPHAAAGGGHAHARRGAGGLQHAGVGGRGRPARRCAIRSCRSTCRSRWCACPAWWR